MVRHFLLVLAATAIALSITDGGYAAAATVTIVSADGPNEGFNDGWSPDPVSTAGRNPGATLGQQRRNAFAYAAAVWGSALVSPVAIKILASMDPLACTASEAVLGTASPQTVHRDFPGAPESWTWYPQALANSLTGQDQAAEYEDVTAVFNSSIGTTCPFPSLWYYGLDGNAPAGTVDFVTVVLHELAHGLGFMTFVGSRSGEKLLGFDDAFMRNLKDHSTGISYPLMSDLEREAANKSGEDLHWTGPNVVDAGGSLSDGRHPSGHVEMYAPNPVKVGSSLSHFSNALTPNELMEPFVTSANHAPGLAAPLFEDMGWELNPVPGIRGNGASTMLKLAEGARLTLTVSMQPGRQDSQRADWWLHARAPDGWYWWTLDAGWIRSDSAIPAYRGPLQELTSFEIAGDVELSPGEYEVYFGVDLIENGILDLEKLSYKQLRISVL